MKSMAEKLNQLPSLKNLLTKKALSSSNRAVGRMVRDIIPGYVFGIITTVAEMWDHSGGLWDDESENWDATL